MQMQFIILQYLNLIQLMRLNKFYRYLSSFSRLKHSIQQKPSTSKVQNLLVFPVKQPIFPYHMSTHPINKYAYEYISRNKIQQIAACILKSGQKSKKFYPASYDKFQAFIKNQYNPQSDLNKGKQDDADNKNQKNNNNQGNKQFPFQYVDDFNTIQPIASLCKLKVMEMNNLYFAQLISQSRIEIDAKKQQDNQPQHQQKQKLKIKPQLSTILNQSQSPDSLSPFSASPSASASASSTPRSPILKIYSKSLSISSPPFLTSSTQAENLQLYNLANILNLTHLFPQPINYKNDKFKQFPTSAVQICCGFLSKKPMFKNVVYDLFTELNKEKIIRKLIFYLKQYLALEQLSRNNLISKSSAKLNQDKILDQVQQQYQTVLQVKVDKPFIKFVQSELATGRFPKEISQLIQRQLKNLSDIDAIHGETRKKRKFIQYLVYYPFGVQAKGGQDINKAKEILDQDHYGMKKVKQRILEFIAVSKIKGEFKSKVLLLHGPPGVGKTSIVKSIAKCLDRPFGRISLGGQSDPAVMKGHRKTYVGAYPGKIFDTIYKAKVQNPVILLDQIDKLGDRSSNGSLRDVIMHVLDPIMNHKFKDEYLDIDIDLSKVLFICTANQTSTIFPPLYDRMEKIQVSGYTYQQKIQIFKRFVVQNSKKEAGIPQQIKNSVSFTDQAMHYLVEGYCKQSGIRNLIRQTDKIFSKMALKIIRNQQFNKLITPKQLRSYLGLPKYTQKRMYEGVPPKGVSIGLAYNKLGGSIMYIESASIQKLKKNQKKQKQVQIISSQPSSPTPSQPKSDPSSSSDAPTPTSHSTASLLITGNLHKVMLESCQLALTYARFIAYTFFSNTFLETNKIHLNFPEIEIGKDGPSAGAAITTSLLSLALDRPMLREIGMTGQIGLSGQIERIGGVREKIVGAKREGVRELIFPQGNQRDVEEVQEEIKEGMKFYFVKHYFEVMEIVFGEKVKEDDDNGKQKVNERKQEKKESNTYKEQKANELKKAESAG